MKKCSLILISIISFLLFVSCSSTGDEINNGSTTANISTVNKSDVDYEDILDLEADIKSEKSVYNKTVRFKVEKINYSKEAGYNIPAGTFLNFYSGDSKPNVKVGDVITVKIIKIMIVFGEYLVKYEIIKKN